MAETKAVKEYTVKYNVTGKKKARTAIFPILADAREFAMEAYREGNLVSLTNAKGVSLPLGGKRKEQQPVADNF